MLWTWIPNPMIDDQQARPSLFFSVPSSVVQHFNPAPAFLIIIHIIQQTASVR
jgi:hypothetical protein